MSAVSPIKTIAFWSNRANDAYAMGEADWAYDPNGNHLTLIAAAHIKAGNWEHAAKAVETEAKSRGIDPKRHRWHPPR